MTADAAFVKDGFVRVKYPDRLEADLSDAIAALSASSDPVEPVGDLAAREVVADYYRSGGNEGMAADILRDNWLVGASPGEVSLVGAIAKALHPQPSDKDRVAELERELSRWVKGHAVLEGDLEVMEEGRNRAIREAAQLRVDLSAAEAELHRLKAQPAEPSGVMVKEAATERAAWLFPEDDSVGRAARAAYIAGATHFVRSALSVQAVTGWRAWPGSEKDGNEVAPIPEAATGQLIDWRLRNGEVAERKDPESGFWHHNGTWDDIVAWRISPDPALSQDGGVNG